MAGDSLAAPLLDRGVSPTEEPPVEFLFTDVFEAGTARSEPMLCEDPIGALHGGGGLRVVSSDASMCSSTRGLVSPPPGQLGPATPSSTSGGPRSPTPPGMQLETSLRSLAAQTPHERRQSLDAIRERYIHHLGQYRLVAGGYVPNLVPILRWNGTSLPGSASGSRLTTPLKSPGGSMLKSPRSGTVGGRQSIRRPSAPTLATHMEAEVATQRGFLRPGSVRSSMINVSAAALGAGALALPRAIYYSGIVLGPLFMFVLAMLSIVSIKVIVQLVEVSGKDSYEEIAKVAFGPWFALLVEVNIILFCFGTAVAYMITVGQISQQVVQSIIAASFGGEAWWLSLLQPNTILCVVTVAILLPLSLLDSINDLRFASLLGVSCILYLIMVVVYVFCFHSVSESLQEPGVGGFDGWQPKGGITGCFKMLSLAIFAFCCQPNVPSIYTELENKSFRRMEHVSIGAMILCLAVYLLMGVTGFLAFGEATAGNVLQNLQPFLCNQDKVVMSGFGCMAFAVTMAFPLNIFPIRFAVETALFFKWPHLNTKTARICLGTAAVAACLVVAILLPDINLVFELIGATTGSFVCFIGPGLLLIRLVPGGTFSSNKRNGWMLVIIGIVFLVLGTYSSVLDVLSQLSQGGPGSADDGSELCPRAGRAG